MKGKGMIATMLMVVGLLAGLTTPVVAERPTPLPLRPKVEWECFSTWANDIAVAPDGTVWAGSYGVQKFDGQIWEWVVPPTDPFTAYTTIAVDEEGLWIWIAFLDDGCCGEIIRWELAHFDEGGWTHFSPPKDFARIVDIEVGDGVVWFASAPGEVGRFIPDEGRWDFWDDSTFAYGRSSIVLLPSGDVWAVGREALDELQVPVFDRENGTWNLQEVSMGTQGVRWGQKAIAADPDGKGVWVEYESNDWYETSSGLAFFNFATQEWTIFPSPFDLWPTLSMAVGYNGMVWVGLEGWDYGLVLFDRGFDRGRWAKIDLWGSGPTRYTRAIAAFPGGVWVTAGGVCRVTVKYTLYLHIVTASQ